MHFDDRLATVMRLPASSAALARIQYRQLVDLLGCLPREAQSQMIEAGLAKLEELAVRIPAAERARLLRQPLQPITNPRLLALLAEAEPDVAMAVIAAARLDEAEWLELIPALPVRARGILRHRRDLGERVEALLERLGIRDRGLPPAPVAAPVAESDAKEVFELAADAMVEADLEPEPATEWARAAAAAKAEKAAASAAAREAGIGAIVRRIEEFRKARGAHAAMEPANDAPRLPLGDIGTAPSRAPATIDFETDEDGRIIWADGPHAPSLVGLHLAAHALSGSRAEGGPAHSALATAIRHRLPLRAAHIGISGAPGVSGEWQVDAIGCFDGRGGRFTGYCGRLRRAAAPAVHRAGTPRHLAEADRMRQVLHELRTPANAIQVAAEIIQQQLYGPAPHEYRALAAAIAGDCAHILAGFEELDRLVKLESGALQVETGDCDIAPILVQTVARLRTWTDPRGAGFLLPADVEATPLPVQVDRIEAERLVWRLLAALAGSTAPNEVLEVNWTRECTGRVSLRIALPVVLAARDVADLFDTPPVERGQTLSAGMFGLGFTLRLASAEAVAVGGALRRDGNDLRLTLPGLTGAAASHSTAVNNFG